MKEPCKACEYTAYGDIVCWGRKSEGCYYPWWPEYKMAQMEFGDAFKALKDGFMITREEWNGSEWRGIKRRNNDIYVFGKNCEWPWIADPIDMFSDDWVIVLEKEDG